MTSIIKCTRNRDYAKISNKLLQNNKLSLKARGLMAYILSLPDTWEICVEHLHDNASEHDGRTAVTGAMKELREFGYLHLERLKDKEGKMAGMRWLAYDDPAENEHMTTGNQVSRLPENPSDGKPTTIKEIGNKGNTETKEIEHKNTGQPSVGCASFTDSKPKQGKAAPLWADVEAHAKREGIDIRAALRFFKVSEYNGWTTKTGPIRCWKRAMVGFIEAEPANAQKMESPNQAEFKKWAYATFDEDDIEQVRAFAALYTKRAGMKRNRITGEMEPIGDIKAACVAFVNECNDRNIIR